MPTYTATDNMGRTITTQSLWQAAAPLTIHWADEDGVTVPKDMARYPIRWANTDAPWADNQADIDHAIAHRGPFEAYLAAHPTEQAAYAAENAKYPTTAPWA